MKKKILAPLLLILLALSAACGGNTEKIIDQGSTATLSVENTIEFIEITETDIEFNQAELDLLEKSRATWNEKNTGTYVYATSFESWVGFGSETIVFVTGDVVTGRNYSSYDADRMPSDSYEESGDSVGSNNFGAPAKTIDELYDECADILKTKPPTQNYITFQLFGDNLLSKCEFFPKDCADDCSEGVRIDVLRITQ